MESELKCKRPLDVAGFFGCDKDFYLGRPTEDCTITGADFIALVTYAENLESRCEYAATAIRAAERERDELRGKLQGADATITGWREDFKALEKRFHELKKDIAEALDGK